MRALKSWRRLSATTPRRSRASRLWERCQRDCPVILGAIAVEPLAQAIVRTAIEPFAPNPLHWSQRLDAPRDPRKHSPINTPQHKGQHHG